ncbi:two-component system regulatory protein YycI [Vagococcus vulneris]|uniref:Regulatory protein YycH-like domain-containing protein n=1 Tax=Vagococcus vulneris TaxID=1977869 RepID=A0A429ZYW1_9ENTE|nr:two-component system regulatory protein YycI [Vagococcus vulneris]RST99163.1 hypothetical protein CBF37_05715 [Vagococcus vulneris]
MDFKRVEGIFLLVFLFLNIFLFYVFQENKVNDQSTLSGTISDQIEERLKADKINAPKNLSNEHREGFYLAANDVNLASQAEKQLKNQEWYVTNNTLHSRFLNENSDQLVIDFNSQQSVVDFISNPDNVIQGSQYHLDLSRSKRNKRYVFSQAWEQIPFLDDTSTLTLIAGHNNQNKLIIESYEQTMLSTDIEPLREKQQLISEREAIISLYTNNRLPAKSKIQRTELGYSRIFTVRGKGVYIPIWIVDVETNKNNTQVERVNAFTSAIITSNVSEVKH